MGANKEHLGILQSGLCERKILASGIIHEFLKLALAPLVTYCKRGCGKNGGVVVSHISDHFLVYISLKLRLPKSPTGFVNVRSYKNYDRDKFVKDLEQVSWHETALVDYVSEMLDHFNINFLNVLESHAPI